MMDWAHDWTDQQIAELTAMMQTAYDDAAKEMSKKLADFLSEYDSRNKEMKSKLAGGEIDQDAYQHWLEFQSQRQVWLQDMSATLAADATRVDQLAIDYVNERIPEVYCQNYNYQCYKIDSEIGLFTPSFTLYDQKTVGMMVADPDMMRLPKAKHKPADDAVWNMRKINGELTQGILQGESIPNASKRLKKVLGMDMRAAVRTARTVMTSAETAGRVESYRVADKAGVKVEKQWIATIDLRTRPSHRLMNKVHVPYDQPFVVGPNGAKMMHPADPKGPASEVYSCRCTLVGWVQGIEAEDPEQWQRLPKGMTYEQWMGAKQNDQSKQGGGVQDVGKDLGGLRKNLSDAEGELNAARSVAKPYRGSEEYYKQASEKYKAERDALKHVLGYDKGALQSESMSIEKEMDRLMELLWGDRQLEYGSKEYDDTEKRYWKLQERADKILDMLQEIRDYKSKDERYRECLQMYEEAKRSNAASVKAYEEAQARIPSLTKKRNAALRELSDAVPFCDAIADKVGRSFIAGLERTIDDARTRHPEIADAFRMFHVKFKVVDAEHAEGAFYMSTEGGIHFNADSDSKGNPSSSPFRTTAHEFGHLIDHMSMSHGYEYWSATEEFEKAIRGDWTRFRNAMGREDGVTRNKNDHAIQRLREEASELDRLEPMLGNKTYSRVSDIIEGCTKTPYPLGWGHGASYHKNMRTSTCTEFVAEYFDSALTDEAAHEQMRRIFPTACAMVDDFVRELLS